MIQYRKALTALATAIATTATLWTDGTLTGVDWCAIALSFLGALGVYALSNEQPQPQ